MKAIASLVLLAALALLAFAHIGICSAQAVTIETVPIGDPYNSPDQNYAGQGQFGAVPYYYRISIHEVTNAEYAVFLTDKAGGSGFDRDPYQLYNPSMDADPRGGISYTACTLFTCGPNGLGNPEWTTYFAKPNMGNKPVNYVSWVDAIRFVNYLNNGAGLFSSIETGACTVGEVDPFSRYPLHPEAITRNPGAIWVLPNENEWYKAAYYQPAAAGGDSDGYWLGPTRSNVTAAVLATSDSVGNISNPGPNVMNEAGATWNGQVGNVTTVGSAGPLASSFYGTFDQGGNVQEWLDDLAPEGRAQRGGSFANATLIGFRADQRSAYPHNLENSGVGFRVARLIPILDGDFNLDGTVNAADYTVWRNNLGATEGTLLSDNGNGGVVDDTDYDLWKAHYGEQSPSGAGSVAANTPEPTSFTLFAIAGFATLATRRR